MTSPPLALEIFRQAPSIVWAVDADLVVTFAHFSAGSTAAAQGPSVVGRSLQDVLREGGAPLAPLLAHLQALEGKSALYSVRWAGLSTVAAVGPHRDEDGAIVGAVGAALDIAPRPEELRALTWGEEILDRVQQIAHVGTFLWDAGARRLELSRPLLRLLGATGAGYDGRLETFLSWVVEEDRAEVEELLRGLRPGRAEPLRFRVVLPSGGVATFQGAVEALDDGGRTLGTLSDVTEQTRHEDDLRRSEEGLRALAGELQRAREEERRALAREVHDVFGQLLTHARLDIQRLRARLPDELPQLRSHAQELAGTIDRLLEATRSLALRLRPAVLDELGLAAALEWHARSEAERVGLDLRFHVDGEEVGVDEEKATTVFRIFQEAVTNVVRHAGATRLGVLLQVAPDQVRLVVDDDGGGLPPDQPLEAEGGGGELRLGILGMSERARAHGGRVRFEVSPWGGTRVIAEIPTRARAE